MEGKKALEELEYRRDIEQINKTMFCPLTNGNCKTTKCMWYDDEPQECAVTNFFKINVCISGNSRKGW